MKIREVMARDISLVDPEASVQEAAQVMADLNFRALPVGRPGEVMGIVTDRDILLRVVAQGRNPLTTRVGEMMSSTLFVCRDDDSVDETAARMDQHQIRRMPVLDRDGHLVGLFTRDQRQKRVIES